MNKTILDLQEELEAYNCAHVAKLEKLPSFLVLQDLIKDANQLQDYVNNNTNTLSSRVAVQFSLKDIRLMIIEQSGRVIAEMAHVHADFMKERSDVEFELFLLEEIY